MIRTKRRREMLIAATLALAATLVFAQPASAAVLTLGSARCGGTLNGNTWVVTVQAQSRGNLGPTHTVYQSINNYTSRHWQPTYEVWTYRTYVSSKTSASQTAASADSIRNGWVYCTGL